MGPGTFTLLVRPKSPKTRLVGWDDERKAYRLNVRAQPEGGKANAEIIKFFSREFGLDARIISGATSHRKVVRLSKV